MKTRLVILNAFSVLAAFAALLRVVAGLLVVCLGVRAVRRWRRSELETGEERFYLLFSLAAALVGLAVVSWPILYLVLQSYVPQWPGVMCIQGVTRIGTGSVGAASHLPGLVAFLEAAKPALVFASGLWLVLHLANRAGATGALTGRVLGALLLCGFLAVADGGAEMAYLLIPKQETFLAAGCCTVGAGGWAAADPSPVLSAQPESTTALTVAFFSVGAAVVLSLTAAVRRPAAAGPWLAVSLLGAVASVPIGLGFLGSVAAPAFLRLPYHQCGYCLISSAPESLVGIVLYVAGAFGAGWAFVARLGAGPFVPLLRIARFGYAGALLMAAVRMLLR